MKCQRCKDNVSSLKMSMFNTQMCCMVCIEIEKRHPRYEMASKEELRHCKNKNFNFKGIGLPDNFNSFEKKIKVSVKKKLEERYF